MKKKLLIFGVYGALGNGVAKILIGKEFNEIYLFSQHRDEKTKIAKQPLRAKAHPTLPRRGFKIVMQ
jgi:saccharopine dehydrogenase-like NADP-dependent oxidoreductase